MENIAFITEQGTFVLCGYAFRAQKCSEIYQRMIDTVFHHQRVRNIEAYMEDIFVKSKGFEEHLKDLKETFDTLRKC